MGPVATGQEVHLRGKVLRSKSRLHGESLDLGDQEHGGVTGKGRQREKKSHWEMITGKGKYGLGHGVRVMLAGQQTGSWRHWTLVTPEVQVEISLLEDKSEQEEEQKDVLRGGQEEREDPAKRQVWEESLRASQRGGPASDEAKERTRE